MRMLSLGSPPRGVEIGGRTEMLPAPNGKVSSCAWLCSGIIAPYAMSMPLALFGRYGEGCKAILASEVVDALPAITRAMDDRLKSPDVQK